MGVRVVCVAVADGRVDEFEAARLFWNPDGTEYHRGPHWHVIYEGGFRQNLPRRYYEVFGPYPTRRT